ncbi:hypothetical protein C8R45DRAFT_1093693 [Mycena sanguinolenta]|nr:hypothetical protein C8R45DRAFT_1093693 [Mycena sanguinolenta]
MSTNPAGCERCGSTSSESHLLPSSSEIAQLRHFLSSSSPLPSGLASSLHNVVDEAPLELERYGAEIQRLEETLARVKSERALLKWYSSASRGLFSPLRRFPAQVLVEIFDMCSPNTTSERHTVEEEENRLARTYLLQPSQVCSRWHTLIMDTSKLWSSIKVDTRVWAQSSIPSATLLHLLESSLDRSGELPLNLEITIDPAPYSGPGVLQLLAQHSSRWRNVFLSFRPDWIDYLVGIKGNLWLLENLALSNADDIRPQVHADNIFFVAPRLKSVTFTGPGWSPGASTFPWSQLRHVKFDSGDFSDTRCSTRAFGAEDSLAGELAPSSSHRHNT